MTIMIFAPSTTKKHYESHLRQLFENSWKSMKYHIYLLAKERHMEQRQHSHIVPANTILDYLIVYHPRQVNEPNQDQ